MKTERLIADMAEGGFSRSTVVATVALGVGVGCINPLQPLLLGAMLDAGRLTVADIGRAATAELVGMAIATTIAALWLKPVHLRRLAFIGICFAATANILTGFATGPGILACRFVNGSMTGLTLWILVGMISRVASPARVFAVYVTVQATASLLLSAVLSNLLLPRLGPVGGYGVLSGIDILLFLFVVPRLADSYGGGRQAVRGFPPLRGLIMLVSVGSLMGGIMAFWVYAIPTLRHLGHGEEMIRLVMPLAIGCQIAGGLFSSVMAERLKPVWTCAGGAVLAATAVALIVTVPVLGPTIVGLCLFTACWMAVPAFQMPLLIAVDPSLRSALMIGSAQLTGLAVGPALAAALVPSIGIGAASGVSIGLILLSLALLPIPFIGWRSAPQTA